MPLLIKKQSKNVGLVPGTLVHVGEERTARVKATVIDYKNEQFREKDRRRKFDLMHEIPMRISLFKTGSSSYRLIWSQHHISMDGWCMGILFKDLVRVYRWLKEGEPVKLAPVRPYANYLEWLDRQDKEAGFNG